MSGYRDYDVMVIDHALWDSVIKRLDCIEESMTHANLRIHMIEKWIDGKNRIISSPSAMRSFVEFITAIIPPSELEKILSGKVHPPKEASNDSPSM